MGPKRMSRRLARRLKRLVETELNWSRAMARSSIALFSLCLCFLVHAQAAEPRAGNTRGYETDILTDTFAYGSGDIDADIDLVFQGCPRRDCIPSIDQPKFLGTAAVDYLDADDIVLSVTHAGITRAYPTRILDHHEIVNDYFADIPVAVSYCPLCGSGLAFVRKLDGEDVEFGIEHVAYHAGGRADDGEGIVDLMRHAGGELTHRGEFGGVE